MTVLVSILFLTVCILLIVIVLLQKGKGQGLSGAFGGMGQSAFGTRVGDVFTWITIVLAGVFLLLAVLTTLAYHPKPQPLDPVTFEPASGTIITERTWIQIRSERGGSSTEIYYTTDGSEPTRDSFRYSYPVPVMPGAMLRARAYRSGWLPSEPASASYPLPQTAKPEFRPAGGNIQEPVKVTITSATEGAQIYYTIDGGEPTKESTLYQAPVMVFPGTTLKAKAYSDERRQSELAEGEYPVSTATAPAPTSRPFP